MEALLSQFTFLSDQALHDKNFDPAKIEDLMKLFELEVYKSWAAMELEHENAIEEAKNSMREAEDYLNSIMDSAMDDFRRFEEELESRSKAELQSLVKVAETAKKMGNSMEKAATIASKKYMEAAVHSATVSMKSARKGLSLNPSKYRSCSKSSYPSKMVLWVFGYGSLIWKAGFRHDDRLVGSTDHRGTPEYPGRTVTLEPLDGEVCWGVAYKVSEEEDEQIALAGLTMPREHEDDVDPMYLEVREKQYDVKAYVDFFTEPTAITPAVSGVMVYIASPDRKLNRNYLGPASLEEMAKQIIHAEGPSGPNRDYLFHLENALLQLGCEDKHIKDLANAVRRILSERKLTASRPSEQ
ncbi:hypothetical protein HHK36_008989 [Tetracentron sinense]|uniref:glutathione-specific gamma-glutamylcyclotransferase n=1 Tax=Tetracentron sinense TaxID=13715 RepID=A0A834Z9W2_TETSI|nr:hypothetical protein HHK36_008989 [Tetracentron sinense]